MLYAQLLHHKPRSDEHLSALKARLSEVAYAYCGSPIDRGDFLMTKECFQAIKALRSNDYIYITKPAKGSGVVILNKNDSQRYHQILNDTTKFLNLGPVDSNNNNAKIELRIQRRLLRLKKDNLISQNVYDAIWFSATTHVRSTKNSQKRCTITTDFDHDWISSAPSGEMAYLQGWQYGTVRSIFRQIVRYACTVRNYC